MYRKGLIRIQSEGNQSGLGDWCSDDSDEYLDFDEDNYEEPWNDTGEGSHQDNQYTHRVGNDPKVEDPEDSDDEDVFYDTQLTPFTAPGSQSSPFTIQKEDEILRSRIEVYHTAYCTQHYAKFCKEASRVHVPNKTPKTLHHGERNIHTPADRLPIIGEPETWGSALQSPGSLNSYIHTPKDDLYHPSRKNFSLFQPLTSKARSVILRKDD